MFSYAVQMQSFMGRVTVCMYFVNMLLCNLFSPLSQEPIYYQALCILNPLCRTVGERVQ